MEAIRPPRYEDRLYVWAIKLLIWIAPFVITFVAGYQSLKSDLLHAESEIIELKESNKELTRTIESLRIQVAIEGNNKSNPYALPQSDIEPPNYHNGKEVKKK